MKIKKLMLKKSVEKEISAFHREFRKHLVQFMTGAFSFIAALLWRDVIKSFIDRYIEYLTSLLPIKEVWFLQLVAAILVTIIAVSVIVIMSRFFKEEQK